MASSEFDDLENARVNLTQSHQEGLTTIDFFQYIFNNM